jgi:hypothetical protein
VNVVYNDGQSGKVDPRPSGVRAFVEVSGSEPCAICDHPDWCQVWEMNDGSRLEACKRTHDSAAPGFVRTGENSLGPFSLYRLDGGLGLALTCNGKPHASGKPAAGVKPSRIDAADRETRDLAYRALLESLELGQEHREALQARGLADEQIVLANYRSLPKGDRAALAGKVLDRLNADPASGGRRWTGEDLLRVPGFKAGDGGGIWVGGSHGVLIPCRDVAGRIERLVVRPDESPKDQDGKVFAKYLYLSSSPGGPSPGTGVHIPVLAGEWKGGTLRITEGILKADVATALGGILTVGCPGVGRANTMPVLEGLNPERVILSFDQDWKKNPSVAQALARLVRATLARGYEIGVEEWDGSRGKGIDDALHVKLETWTKDADKGLAFVLGRVRELGVKATVEPDEIVPLLKFYGERRLVGDLFRDVELLDGIAKADQATRAEVNQLARKYGIKRELDKALRGGSRDALSWSAPGTNYLERDGCTLVVLDQDGEKVERPLANFTARITREVARHECGEVRRQFEIHATHRDGSSATALVRADDFELMAWVPSLLGSKFGIEPGRGTRDLMRHAIQTLSHREPREPVEAVDVHTALGWHEIAGENVYLHAGGGIDAQGVSPVHVDPTKELAPYAMPAPDPSRLAAGVRKILEVPGLLGAWDVGSLVVSLPFRAVLGPTRFAVHFSGTSGSFKTSTAVLAARFFAPGLEWDSPMPATWASTANSIQRLQHEAGDVILLVDNLIADGDQAARELHKADATFNSQGDLGGRRRMRPDGSLAASLDPRTTLLSSGECDPGRRSAMGRALIVEFAAGKLELDAVESCHAIAREGHFAAVMACYVRHLATPGRLDAAREEVRQLTAEGRREAERAVPGAHPRQYAAVAEIVAGLRVFLAFAVEQGAVDEARAEEFASRAEASLRRLLEAQATLQREVDPAEMYLECLKSALAAKRAILHATDGTAPPLDIAGAAGWEQVPGGTSIALQPVPGAARIGWIDDSYIYLNPDAAYAAAGRIAREKNQPMAGQRQVHARLMERGLLIPDGTASVCTRREMIEGTRKRILKLDRGVILDEGDAWERDSRQAAARDGSMSR